MKITLKPMPQTAGSICVGTLDGRPLAYVGRTPYIDGVETAHDVIAEALKDAVDEACSALWGAEWPAPLAVVGVLNRRATSKDRVWRNGLPPSVLRLIAEAAAHESPRIYGDFLLGVCRVEHDAFVGSQRGVTATTEDLDRRVISHVQDAIRQARVFRQERATAASFEFRDTDS